MTELVRRSFLHLTVKSFRKIYKSFIRPHLEYGNVVWHPRFKKDIEALERAQRRATKLVNSIRNLPYHEILKTLKIPTLSYRRFRGDMIEVYKLLNAKEGLRFETFFQRNEQSTRGHCHKLRQWRSLAYSSTHVRKMNN